MATNYLVLEFSAIQLLATVISTSKFKIINRIEFLLLIVVFTRTFTVFGQIKYIETSDDRIVDTTTYTNTKSEEIQKMKSIFRTRDV